MPICSPWPRYAEVARLAPTRRNCRVSCRCELGITDVDYEETAISSALLSSHSVPSESAIGVDR